MERRLDVMRAVAIIGFIIALGLAVLAFSQQQQAQENTRLAQTQAAEAEAARVTAISMAQEASGTQVQAEAARVTAIAQAEQAGTALAEAESGQGTAVAQAEIAGTQAAQIVSTSQAAVGDIQATLQAETDSRATDQAQSEAALATVRAEMDAQATIQINTLNQLSTATAQIDLAAFARESAEEDRLAALEQAWAAATALAESQSALATAQAVISGVTATPSPIPPPATSTPIPEPTEVFTGEIPPLNSQFVANGGRVTFNFPNGWEAVELDNGVILVGDSRATLQRSEPTLSSGQFEITLLVNPVTNIRDVEAGASSADVMQSLLAFFAAQNPPLEFSEPESSEIGTFPITRVLGQDSNNEMTITAVDMDNDISAVIFAYSSQGEVDILIEVLDGMIATLAYSG